MKGALKDLVRDMVIQVDSRGMFSTAKEPDWQDAAILDLLSHQFTCTILKDKTFGFRFYKDRDNTWRFKS